MIIATTHVIKDKKKWGQIAKKKRGGGSPDGGETIINMHLNLF